MRALPFLILLAGCASSTPAPTTPSAPPPADEATPAASGPPSEAECSAAFSHDFALTAKNPELVQLMGEVRANFVLTCTQEYDRVSHLECTLKARDAAGIDACGRPELSRHTPSANTPALACERPKAPFGPVIVTAEQYLARPGASAGKLSEIAGSAEEPLENCGLQATAFQLARLTCEDGSRPLKTFADVEKARRGSVGEGGRCKSILDLYAVPCPEKTYEIHTDMYMCLPDAWPE